MRTLCVLVISILFFSCVRNKDYKSPQKEIQVQEDPSGSILAKHVVKVEEVIQGKSYSYILVTENEKKHWIAVSKQEVNVGEVCYYEKALQMDNFKSKELERTFDVIYFVTQLSKDPLILNNQPATKAHSGKVQNEIHKEIKIEKAESALTIAGIFANMSSFSGEKVKVTGLVVKVNKGIMGRNWLHIQDGTNHSGNFDLTITSQEVANVGDTVTFEGTITLNKNFGSGYSYDVIMENAILTGKEM